MPVLMRVAALYGDRPDFWRTVEWHILVSLSSPSLPDEVRLEFERQLAAGLRVLSKEIGQVRVAAG